MAGTFAACSGGLQSAARSRPTPNALDRSSAALAPYCNLPLILQTYIQSEFWTVLFPSAAPTTCRSWSIVAAICRLEQFPLPQSAATCRSPCKPMSSLDSKKFYFTLTAEEAAELEQAAAHQQISAAQVIRNRLREWQQTRQTQPCDRTPSAMPDESKLLEKISQLDSRLTELHQTFQQFDPNRFSAQTNQQLRAGLQPLYQRLQQLEAHSTETGKVTVQITQNSAQITQAIQGERTLPIRFQRVEAFLEAIHLLTERLLIGLTPVAERDTEQAILNEVHTHLFKYLEKGNGRLDR
jgi:hypothetical protein